MEKIWLKSYKSTIPPEIECDESTLVDWFKQTCRQYGSKPALTCHKFSLSFSQVAERVEQIAAGLARLGVSQGDRVAIILPNSIQYPLTVFATLTLGASVVNINPLYTPSEIEYILQDAEPKVVVVLDMFAAKLNGFHGRYGIQQIVVSKMADPYPLLKRTLINLVLRYVAKVNPKLTYTAEKWRNLYNYQQGSSQAAVLKPATISAGSLAFLQYTGATTGHPKGAMLLHRNVVANVRQIFAVIEPQVPGMDQQVVINALPMYHIFSLTANLLAFFLHGSENVMIPNARNIKDLVKTMNSTPFTILNSLDTLYYKLLEYPPFLQAEHPSFKYGICGGMATRQSVAERWYQHTGLYPTNCYGLTETSPCLSMSYFDEHFSLSVGYPVPSTEVDIREISNGQHSLAQGEVGLIFVRGPQVMAGYWRNPQQTALALSADGWLNTGDIGYVDQRGRLYISGRHTEMIIVSGFNVYPAELELVIDQLAEVREVAVVGYSDQDTGEAIHAFIVFVPEHKLSNADIMQHCRQSLTKYKLPQMITVVDELPKTPVGKIDKKALVAHYFSPAGE